MSKMFRPRTRRFFGLSSVDLLVTGFGAVLITYHRGRVNTISVCRNFLGLVSVGCITHAALGVDAALNRYLTNVVIYGFKAIKAGVLVWLSLASWH
jgi:hypothetical protein